jgi:hypothetical protein
MTDESFGIHKEMSAQYAPTPGIHTPRSVGLALYSTPRVIVLSHAHAATLVVAHKFADRNDQPGFCTSSRPARGKVWQATQRILFSNELGKPMNLEAPAVDVIRPALEKANLTWHGWHAFRRGLATNLHRLGVSDKVIQQILRHTNVSTTMNIYVKTVSSDAANAMRTLETISRWKAESRCGIGDQAGSGRPCVLGQTRPCSLLVSALSNAHASPQEAKHDFFHTYNTADTV